MNYTSKYETLPNIQTARSEGISPRHNGSTEQQIVPLLLQKSYSSNEDVSRVRTLELRIAAMEQSHRTLLDEVMRLQSEQKLSSKRREDFSRQDLYDRQKVAETIRLTNEYVAQIGNRLQQAEGKIDAGQTAVGGLLTQVKRIEQNLSSSQQEVISKNGSYANRLQELQASLDETADDKNKLQHITYTLVDEISSLKAQLQQKAQHLESVSHELQKRSLTLESENRGLIDRIRQSQESKQDHDFATQQLRTNMEARLTEVRDALVDIRNKVLKEESERLLAEQALSKRISDAQTTMSDITRRGEDTAHEVSKLYTTMQQLVDKSTMTCTDRILRSEDELRRRIQDSDLKTARLVGDKLTQLEKTVSSETEHRHVSERSIREETQIALNEMHEKLKEDILNTRKIQKVEKSKLTDSLTALNDSVTLVERQCTDTVEKLSKALKSEVLAREGQDRNVAVKVDEMNHKLSVAITSLQQAITGTKEDFSRYKEEHGREIVHLKDDLNLTTERGFNDIDQRIIATNTKLKDITLSIQMKVEEANLKHSEKVADALRQLNVFQQSSSGALADMKEALSRLVPQVADFESSLAAIKLESLTRIDTEQASRIKDVQQVRKELSQKTSDVASSAKMVAFEQKIQKLQDDLDIALADISRQSINSEKGLAEECKHRTEALTDLREKLEGLRSLVQIYHQDEST